MSMINTNTISLNAQRNLSSNSASLATTIQRLSSGLRINSARDDAAGLAISERFTTQIRGLNQAARNANDGISLAQVAEGALGEIGNNLQRIRELAVQSRNATNSQSDRGALQAEAAQLLQEIDRVANQTQFNGLNLLNGSFTSQQFQVGANQGQTIGVNAIVDANIDALGSWISVPTPSAPVAGVAPVAPGGTAFAGGTNTFTPTGFDFSGAGGPAEFTVAGIAVSLNTNVTDATGLATAIQAQLNAPVAGRFTVTNAAGTLTITDTTSAAAPAIAGANADAIAAGITNAAGSAGTAATSGTFVDASFQLNGTVISVTAAGSQSAQLEAARAAINAATGTTGVSASIASGALTLTSVGGTGNIDIALNTGTDQTALTANLGLTAALSPATPGTAQTGFASLDISTVTGADNAILGMDAALTAVNSARADLGAIQNRFASVVSNLNTTSENLAASRSRIRDTDYARETAELTRTQILQQAGTAMLAQANQIPQNVLSLLR